MLLFMLYWQKSQCSTVVRNTVVRAAITVNGKFQILGTRSPQTSESIDLKFDLDDDVGGLTLRAKNGTNRPNGWRGKGVKYNVQLGYFFIFKIFFLPSSGEHIFESSAAFFALDDVFQRGLIA